MLLSLPDFKYYSCKTVEEACSLLSDYKGDARVFAGGTDMLVKMKHRSMTPNYLINIKKIPGLDYIRYDESDGLMIGTLTTIDSLALSSVVTKKFPVLGQAASVLGTPHVRAIATLGGNVCNASPAAECAPALLTMEAKCKIVGPTGERFVPFENFFVSPGKSVLQDNEILTEIQIPNLPPHTGGVHLKYGSRRVDVAIVGVCVLMTLDGHKCHDVKIALSAVGPTPFRAKKAEDVLRGETLGREKKELVEKAAVTAAGESVPISDIRGRADQRKELVKVLVRDGIERLVTEMIHEKAGSRAPVKSLN